MAKRSIWTAFIETLAAALTPFAPMVRAKVYRNASWWPV